MYLYLVNLLENFSKPQSFTFLLEQKRFSKTRINFGIIIRFFYARIYGILVKLL